MFQFYRKLMATQFTILQRSAMSAGTKRNSLFQEALRRLRNCHPDIDWKVKVNHLNSFSNMMKVSGYDAKYRYETIKGAVERHREMLRLAETGEINLFRTRREIKESKLERGGNSASSWHLKGETTSTVNIAATPGGILKRTLSEALEKIKAPDGGKTKVIERGGKPVFAGVEEGDPFQKPGCQYEEGCIVEEGTNCAQVNTCYEIACTMCESEQEWGGVRSPVGTQARWVAGRRRGVIKKSYIGNTGRTLHGRAIQHMGGLRRGDKGNPLYKHCLESHPNSEIPKFTMRIISKHKTNIHRMITEGVFTHIYLDDNI